MDEQDRYTLFSELVARYHSQLYAYIFAVVKNREDTDDIFQSVCLVLWQKFALFRPGSSFFAWARQTAKLMICNYLRHKRSVSARTSEDLLDALGETVATVQGDEVELHMAALRWCRKKLNTADEELLRLRYVEELAIGEVADRMQRLQPSICRSLNRIRRWLFECIQTELARREPPERGFDER
jgi:RNA polymerase sigma-70 factor, ECF subfamily